MRCRASPARSFREAIRVQRLFWFLLSFLTACAVARGADAAPIGPTFSLLDGEFSVRRMNARDRMLNTVADARALVRGDIARAGPAVRADFTLINFFDPENGFGGHFAAGEPFPGNTPDDDQAFAVRVRGWVDIPQPGVYTFGVNSDDGFRMRIGPLFMRHGMPRFTADTLGSAAFMHAGRYRLKLTYFEQGNGAELELFAARGIYNTFAEGALPTGIVLPPADPPVSPPLVVPPSEVSVPEPGVAAMTSVIALWTLAAGPRGRRRASRAASRSPARRCSASPAPSWPR
jgi:hypothetical protein